MEEGFRVIFRMHRFFVYKMKREHLIEGGTAATKQPRDLCSGLFPTATRISNCIPNFDTTILPPLFLSRKCASFIGKQII